MPTRWKLATYFTCCKVLKVRITKKVASARKKTRATRRSNGIILLLVETFLCNFDSLLPFHLRDSPLAVGQSCWNFDTEHVALSYSSARATTRRWSVNYKVYDYKKLLLVSSQYSVVEEVSLSVELLISGSRWKHNSSGNRGMEEDVCYANCKSVSNN